MVETEKKNSLCLETCVMLKCEIVGELLLRSTVVRCFYLPILLKVNDNLSQAAACDGNMYSVQHSCYHTLKDSFQLKPADENNQTKIISLYARFSIFANLCRSAGFLQIFADMCRFEEKSPT